MKVSRREFLGMAVAAGIIAQRKSTFGAKALIPTMFLPMVLSKPADNQMWVTLENGTKRHINLYWECGFWECYPTIQK